MYLRYNDIGEEVRLLQRALNEKLNLRLKADGVFGKLTEEALRQYQRLHNLHVTGVYGQFEISLLGNFITAKYIREKDLELIALNNNLPISIVKAIKEVEARADGFLYDGRAVILLKDINSTESWLKNQVRLGPIQLLVLIQIFVILSAVATEAMSKNMKECLELQALVKKRLTKAVVMACSKFLALILEKQAMLVF